MKVSITTLGCKSNQYDSLAIEAALKENHFKTSVSSDEANVFIINTCTVTGKADYQSRQLIRRARVANPDAVILVTGCYAQVSPHDVAQIEGVDYILGNPEKEQIIEYIRKGKRDDPAIAVSEADVKNPLGLRAKGASGRTRAYLKVQDGCDSSCSYCIIPRARGASRSLSISDVLREIDGLVEEGYREIIITGIHLGSYGLDSGKDIAALIRAIDEKGYPCRFRISSLDPDEVSDELIEIIAGSRTVCNHFHLPLQSGDDTVLQRMNRSYTGRFFADRVEKIARAVPDVSIGVDIIAGFPGEGEREFLNSYRLLESLPIAYMHVFPFSKRKGTPAADFTGQVESSAVKVRCERLRLLGRVKKNTFYCRFVGKRLRVLVEASRDRDTGFLNGRSKNYIPFVIQGGDGLKNAEIDIVASEIKGDKMAGYAMD